MLAALDSSQSFPDSRSSRRVEFITLVFIFVVYSVRDLLNRPGEHWLISMIYNVRYSYAESDCSLVENVFVNSDRANELRDTASLNGELLDTAIMISPSDGRN